MIRVGFTGSREYPRPDLVETKTCVRCREEKSLDDFHRQQSAKDGHTSACKPCNRERASEWRRRHPERARAHVEAWCERNPDRARAHRRNKQIRRYGIEPTEYQVLLDAQEGKCAICGGAPDGVLAIDHDHETGRVRGLLCRGCNTGIGQLGDNPDLLRVAADYLEEASCRP